MTPTDGLRRLEREGDREREELASDIASVRAQAREWERRSRPWLLGTLAVASAAAVALVAGRVARSRGSKTRRAVRRVAKQTRKYRPRPIPVTLLFTLLRTPAVRRALAAGAGRLVREASGGDRSADVPPALRESGPRREPDKRPERILPSGHPRSLPGEGAGAVSAESPGVRAGEANRTVPPAEIGERKAKQTLEELKHSPLKKKVGFVVSLFKEAFTNFNGDEALTRGAALAYYTLLSLAPLLVVVVAVAGLAFGAENVRAQILSQIGQLVGQDATKTIAGLMAKASKPSQSIPAAVLGFATLLLGAGGVFGYLHDMLNKIWKVPPKKTGGIWSAIRSRFLSLAMVLGTGFLLLVSLVVSAALSAIGKSLGDDVGLVLNVLHQVVSWAVIGVMFALIFRFLPDTRIAWRDVWIGAGITSLLFALGQFLIGVYLGRGAVASVYGGAGSLVIVLLWTYYSGLILFFGAEVTHVFATRWGSRKEVGGRVSEVGSRR